MKNYEIENILRKSMCFDEIYVNGENKYFQIIAVSKCFIGMNRIQKQKMIYEPLTQYISENIIHALSIKAYTPNEWKKLNEKK